MDNKDLIRRLDALESQRKNLDTTLEFIEKFVVPFRGNFFSPNNSEGEVDWRKRDKYDDTAVQAAQTLASSMQGSLTSQSMKWFDARYRIEELNTHEEAKRWLEACVEIMYKALQDSDFDLEASELYLDLVSFATGIVIEEEEWDGPTFKGLDFTTIPMQDCYFETDHKDNVLRLYRKLKWTASQIISKFGIENVPKEIKDKAANAQSVDEKIDVIFCVYDRPENRNADTSKKLAAKARPFGKKYILRKSAETIGEEGGYYEMPGFVCRWRKASGSQWGYSPAMVALGDILTLNELTEATLEALAKVVDPATLATERGLLSDLDLGRGGLTIVRNVDDVKSYESKARFDIGDLKIERLKESINRAFHVDQLQLKDSPAMTATEVQVRYELMQRLLGPTLGRLINDFLDPLIRRTFNILYRAGQFPPVPDIVVNSGSEIDIEYVGPLPRAQRMEVVSSVQQWVSALVNLSEIRPDILDIPDFDKIARGSGEMMGVPAKYIRDSKTVDKERAANAKRQRDQSLVAEVGAAGEAMQSFGKGRREMQQ